MFNEELLSLGCHQLVVIRSQVILRQLELGRVQMPPEKGSKVQSPGQISCLAPSCRRWSCHSSTPGAVGNCVCETQARLQHTLGTGALLHNAIPWGEMAIGEKKTK